MKKMGTIVKAYLTAAVFVIALQLATALLATETDSGAPATNPDQATGGKELGGPPVWPPYESLEAVLQKWAHEHPNIMALEQLGLSREGRPGYAIVLTDPAGAGTLGVKPKGTFSFVGIPPEDGTTNRLPVEAHRLRPVEPGPT